MVGSMVYNVYTEDGDDDKVFCPAKRMANTVIYRLGALECAIIMLLIFGITISME